MKWIGLLCGFLVFNSGFTQVVYQSSFENALKKAKSENKLVFVKYYAETCSHCQDLQRVLTEDSVSRFFNTQFVSFKINSEDLTEKDQLWLKKYAFSIDQIPILFFFNSSGEFIHYATPKQEAKSVLKAARAAIDPLQRCTYYPTLYKQGTREIVTLKMYSKYMQLMANEQMVNELADTIFHYTPQTELFTAASIITSAKYVKSIQNGFFAFWMKNYEKLDSVATNFTLEEKQKVFKDILANDINQHAKMWTIEQIKLAKEYIRITQLNPNSEVYTWERELELYFIGKKEKEGFDFVNQLLTTNQQNYYQQNYILIKLATFLQTKTQYEQFVHLKAQYLHQEMDPFSVANLMAAEVKLLKRIGDDSNYTKQKSAYLDYCKLHDLEVEDF